MNFMSHGRDVVHDPWRLTGTQLPDLLRARGRRFQVPHDAHPNRGEPNTPRARLAAGIQLHFHEDEWFHQSADFVEICSTLTRLFRSHTPPGTRFRASFFAHICSEMLLDAWLMQEEPAFADRYYASLGAVDGVLLSEIVAEWGHVPKTEILSSWDRFVSSEFLRGYSTDEGCAARANGLFQRIGLPELPAEVRATFPMARRAVYRSAPKLLRRANEAREPRHG